MVRRFYCGWPVIMLFVFTDKNLSNTPSIGWEITTHFSAYSRVTTVANVVLLKRNSIGLLHSWTSHSHQSVLVADCNVCFFWDIFEKHFKPHTHTGLKICRASHT